MTPFRSLRRSPGFALVATLTLAPGIGSTTAVFSILDAVILRGLPYRDADRLAAVYERNEDGKLRVPSYPTFLDLQQQAGAASGVIAGLAYVRGDAVTLAGTDAPEKRVAAFVTPGFFALMGTRPALGRTFLPDEERPGAGPVAVISWESFRDRFGGDAAIIGRTIDVDSVPTTVVGVMPHGFAYPNFADGAWLAPALWEPIAIYQPTHPQLAQRGLHVDSRTIMRLQPGADSMRAAAVMQAIERRLEAEYPAEQAHWTGVSLQPVATALYGSVRTAMAIIAAAVGLVLLLACANLANLFLVRVTIRTRELAVRAAIGASRWRLVRGLLAEALVLSFGACILGVVIASVIVRFVSRNAATRLPFANELHLDVRATVFASAVAVITAVLVGIVPALQASAGDLMMRLRSGGVSEGGGAGEHRLRAVLVSMQFALAVVVLVGAGLLLQSFRRLAAVDTGIDSNGVIAFAIGPASHRYDTPAEAAALYGRIIDAMHAVPGVSAAAAAGGALLPTPVTTDASTTDAPPEALYRPVSPDYRTVMRLPLVEGRWFTEADMRSPVGFVISNALARRLWPGADPIGRRITVRRQSQARADFGQRITLPVIGVVGDVREYGPADVPQPEVYLPYTLEVWPWMQFVVRARNPSGEVRAIDQAVRAVDPALNYRVKINIMRSGAAAVDAQQRFITSVVSGFAAFALLLAAVGLYSIVAFGVAQRARELGVRIALGAPNRSVFALVLREAGLLVVVGSVIGLAGALLCTRLIRDLLFDTAPSDPATLAVVLGILAAVCVLATWRPARHATHIDPMVAMRAD